jgi:hypothetical protein
VSKAYHGISAAMGEEHLIRIACLLGEALDVGEHENSWRA